MHNQMMIRAILLTAAAAVALASGTASGQPGASAGLQPNATGDWQVTDYNPVIGSGCPASGWRVSLTETAGGDVDGTYGFQCGSTPARGEIVAHRYGNMIRGVWISRSGYGRIIFEMRPDRRIRGQGRRPATPQTFNWNMVRVP